ncbi:RluA family pseudouridine synthase [Polyangium spumosum]|uniref:RluA family pseudouridine synthase n=1 Tax=Polyangium spumosum TaxID=889282 RepID=A0A6N7PJ17_9BACT|nr:RluA family pseudouridine synthase [Polyangium spumosum]MRG92102.1 RluA family pseudouridine synthase [Polyangium spumosum]
MSLSHQRHRFVARPEDAGQRLDQVLAANVPGLSRRKARVAIDLGGVFVDGARVKVAGRAIKPGQTILAHLGGALDRATKEVGAAARARDEKNLPPFRVVHQDEDLVVVDKPSGLVTAPTPESDRGNLADLLGRALGGTIYVVHRLDLDTSGLVVFARTESANRALSDRIRAHDFDRVYLAALHGHVPWDERTIEEPVAGKRAISHAAVLERLSPPGSPGVTLTRFRLTTGRTHQIRLHARHEGHPVLGDRKYGSPSPVDPPRLALHATLLGFVHPRTGEALSWESPWPDDLATWLEGVRGAAPPPR